MEKMADSVLFHNSTAVSREVHKMKHKSSMISATVDSNNDCESFINNVIR